MSQPRHDIKREEIKIAAPEGQIDAYLATPVSGTPTGPAVVMVSSVFGIDQDLKNACDDLASRGHVALAQNFFWRDQDPGPLTEPDVQRAIGRAMRSDFPKSMQELALGLAEVRRQPACNGKVAVFGYCFGGPHAWRAACDGLPVDATISFHGTMVSKCLRPGDQPKCPVAFYYGSNDHLAPPEELEAVRKVAEAAGSEFIVHEGAGHAFMMPSNSHYSEAASRAAWQDALQLIATLRT